MKCAAFLPEKIKEKQLEDFLTYFSQLIPSNVVAMARILNVEIEDKTEKEEEVEKEEKIEKEEEGKEENKEEKKDIKVRPADEILNELIDKFLSFKKSERSAVIGLTRKLVTGQKEEK